MKIVPINTQSVMMYEPRMCLQAEKEGFSLCMCTHMHVSVWDKPAETWQAPTSVLHAFSTKPSFAHKVFTFIISD